VHCLFPVETGHSLESWSEVGPGWEHWLPPGGTFDERHKNTIQKMGSLECVTLLHMDQPVLHQRESRLQHNPQEPFDKVMNQTKKR